MTAEQLREAVARGSEQPSVEFKSGGPRTDKKLLAKVLRAILAMANRRDGGVVILGIEEHKGTIVPAGIEDADAETWRADHLADSIAPYASPHIEFDVSTCVLDGKSFLIVKVREFADTPVLCKKHFTINGEVLLREGACYIRPRHKPESTEVNTYADMRDLLELAAEKALRRFVRTMDAVGIHGKHSDPSDAESFRNQLGELA